uniref:Uncharacterized protein n=1 Tax=Setaria italica TaxID=4555 RepID=K4ANQ6_SETIT
MYMNHKGLVINLVAPPLGTSPSLPTSPSHHSVVHKDKEQKIASLIGS